MDELTQFKKACGAEKWLTLGQLFNQIHSRIVDIYHSYSSPHTVQLNPLTKTLIKPKVKKSLFYFTTTDYYLAADTMLWQRVVAMAVGEFWEGLGGFVLNPPIFSFIKSL